MDGKFILLFILSAWFAGTCLGFEWSDNMDANSTKYACTGSSAIFAWSLTLNASAEDIMGIRWIFHGQSEEVIAMYSLGTFVALPSFAQRANQLGSAGIFLSHVTSGDTGNYSVEVTVRKIADGGLFTLKRFSFLQVIDGLMTTDGQLSVTQWPVALFSNVTRQWHVVLACGTFVFSHRPPFNVTWTTPKDVVAVESTRYQDGHYLLLLPNPTAAGSYTCSLDLPPGTLSATCPSGNVTARASVTVDATAGRLSVLEAQQTLLLVDNEKMKRLLEERNASSSGTSELCCSDVTNNHTHLTRMVLELQNQMLYLLHNSSGVQRGSKVSFHARGLRHSSLQPNDVLVLPAVSLNDGGGYDPDTGYFTAPLGGVYAFLGSAQTSSQHVGGLEMALMMENSLLDFATAFGMGQGGVVHAVASLAKGQRVYLQSYQRSDLWDQPCSFSGLLIYTD